MKFTKNLEVRVQSKVSKVIKLIFLGFVSLLFVSGVSLLTRSHENETRIQQTLMNSWDTTSVIKPGASTGISEIPIHYSKDEVCCYLMSGLDCTVILNGVAYSYDTFDPLEFDYSTIENTNYKVTEHYNGATLVHVTIEKE